MNDILTALIRDDRIWQGSRRLHQSAATEATGFPPLDTATGGLGWPRGALTECLLDDAGIGELTLVLPLLRRLSGAGRSVFWINPPHIPYAPALERAGVALEQLVVIHTSTADDTLWTLENCLRSAATGLVMAWPGRLAGRDIRRLQLAAEAGDNHAILFRHRSRARQSSPAALRLELAPAPRQGLEVRILKRRGGWPGQPCLLDMADRSGAETVTGSANVLPGPWSGPEV